MGAALKVLLVEDNLDHAELITKSLGHSIPSTHVHHTTKHQDCLTLLEKKRYDIVLMDYYLSDTLGLNLLREVSRLHPEIPVVIITGQGDEKTAAKSIKAGAEDYVVKTRESLEALPKIITRTLQKHKTRKKAKGKSTTRQKKKNDRLLSGLFKEIEEISLSLKSIYKRANGKRTNGKSPQKKLPPAEIKKLPRLEKQMWGLKTVMKKLFGSS